MRIDPGNLGGTVTLAALLAVAPLALRPDGIRFPDGTVQTTAAGGGPRAYYLTQLGHQGATAAIACEDGFHMASLWEILDPSGLRYAHELAAAEDDHGDQGEGPPSSLAGWVRTGFTNNGGTTPGFANCVAWLSSAPSNRGTTASLQPSWSTTTVDEGWPWSATVATCDAIRPVWCVAD